MPVFSFMNAKSLGLLHKLVIQLFFLPILRMICLQDLVIPFQALTPLYQQIDKFSIIQLNGTTEELQRAIIYSSSVALLYSSVVGRYYFSSSWALPDRMSRRVFLSNVSVVPMYSCFVCRFVVTMSRSTKLKKNQKIPSSIAISCYRKPAKRNCCFVLCSLAYPDRNRGKPDPDPM
jgi:hypothetical protein